MFFWNVFFKKSLLPSCGVQGTRRQCRRPRWPCLQLAWPPLALTATALTEWWQGRIKIIFSPGLLSSFPKICINKQQCSQKAQLIFRSNAVRYALRIHNFSYLSQQIPSISSLFSKDPKERNMFPSCQSCKLTVVSRDKLFIFSQQITNCPYPAWATQCPPTSTTPTGRHIMSCI